MASLTIRQLDDDVKRRLRLRAARNGRSMEEEARHLELSQAPAARPNEAVAARSEGGHAGAASPAPAEHPSAAALAGRRILLVIGGGIAAYKSLDLIRRLQERGAAVRVVMT